MRTKLKALLGSKDRVLRAGRARWAAYVGAFVLLLLGASVPAYAQSVSFTGVQTTLPLVVANKALNLPQGVAVDSSGDVFIADTVNQRVVEILATGTQIQLPLTVAGKALNEPEGVAVDSAGDVFIADTDNNRVVELPANNGPQSTVGTGLNRPASVAVDSAGDVFIADTNNSRVVKVAAGTGAQSTVGSGLSYPSGVAADGAGDVFIADTDNQDLWKVSTSGSQVLLMNMLGYPTGVTVDGGGNVFIADSIGPTSSWLLKIPAGGGAAVAVGTGLSFPFELAVDGKGDVFIADDNNNRVVEVQPGPANFGDINVCPAGATTPSPCSATLTLDYSVNEDTNFGSTLVLTQGAPNLDFTPSNTTAPTVCTGSVQGVRACSVGVSFAPRAPGLRMGAAQLLDSSGNLLVTTLVSGEGLGPAIAFGPGAQTAVGTELTSPGALAVDVAGDVFIADQGTNQIVEVSAAGAQSTVSATGLSFPNGVAVDGAGNVFVSDTNNNRVIEVSNGFQTTLPPTVDGIALNQPYGAAVDGAGDVFVADQGNNRVVEFLANGTQATLPVVVSGEDLNGPVGVAVDAAGDVFIADTLNSRVVEVPFGGSGGTTVGTGLKSPRAVAVDGAGDVFIADTGNDRVVEVLPDGTQATVGPLQGTLQGTPTAVALDGAGDLFIALPGTGKVAEIQSSQPPALNFAETAVGSTSTDSPQSATVQNIGNQPLLAVAPGLTVAGLPAFMQVPGSGSPADCNSSFSLAPGARCDLSISFTPETVGINTGSATFTDNALNAAAAVQNVSLQGNGVSAGPMITSVSPDSGPTTGGETVMIAGQNFLSNATVFFGSTQATATWNSESSISAVVPALPPGVVTITVTNPDGQSATIGFTVLTATSPQVDLSLNVTTLPSVPFQNMNLTYLFTVTNNGPSIATNATITLPIFSSAQYVSVTPSQGSCSPLSAASPSCNLGTILVGFSASFTLVVTPTAAGPLTASFSGTADQVDIDPVTTLSVTVQINPSLTINETINVSDQVSDWVSLVPLINVAAPVAFFSTDTVGFGSASGTQTIAVSNIGESQTGLQLTSAVVTPAGAFSIGTISCSNNVNTFATTLPSGGTCLISITYTAPATGTPPSATLTFTDNAALSNLPSTPSSGSYTQSISLNGAGTTTSAPPPPQAVIPLTISETITVNDQPQAATLQSIAVTPVNPTIAEGAPEAFTATGTFSNGTTQDLTAAVTWLSSNTNVAAMTANTATAGNRLGQTKITAKLGSTGGSTTLTVLSYLSIDPKFSSVTLAANGGYIVKLAVTNNGDTTASNVTAIAAILGTKGLSSSIAATNLASGGTGIVTLVFPASAGIQHSKQLLVVGGLATGTNPNGTPVLPAIWALPPTQVTLP